MPDHLHAIWTMPAGDADYSLAWALIRHDSRDRLALVTGISPRTVTVSARLAASLREHTIRDERDLENHVNYIHTVSTR